ncbi:MAG: phosphoenolpyruvate--protein phosphotransferase [Desulfurella sp.]
MSNNIVLKGTKASEGIGIGKLIKIEYNKTYNQKNKEALDTFYSLKQNLLNKIHWLKNIDTNTSQIFEIYEAILNDPYFEELIKKYINQDLSLSETISKTVSEISYQLSNTNQYMKERVSDIERLGIVLQNPDVGAYQENTVICFNESLAVIDLINIDIKKIKGIVTNSGSKISHLAIWCRNNNIPFIYNIDTKQLKEGLVAAIDLNGYLIINPTQDFLDKLSVEKLQREKIINKAQYFKSKVSKFKNKEIKIGANIGNLEDAYVASQIGVKSVGLFRTEFMFLEKDKPLTQEQQYKIYKEAASLFTENVIIRTMDIGGDKKLNYLDLKNELNPFLGIRGLRLSLKYKELFKTQLKAILKAAYDQKNICIMFPMVSIEEEINQAKNIINDLAYEMDKQNEPYRIPQIGIMIEVPSAALNADKLIKLVDFMSIGTNDLIQYTMAMDRTNNEVDYLYQPYNNSIIKLIQNVINACHLDSKWAGMCGAMAGELLYYPLLLEIGLDEFSMESSQVMLIKMYNDYLQSCKLNLLPWDDSKLHLLQELYKNFLEWAKE